MNLWVFLFAFLLVQGYSLSLPPYAIVESSNINISTGDILEIHIEHNGNVYVEITLNNEAFYRNFDRGIYEDVNMTFADPGSYRISLRNPTQFRHEVNYLITVKSANYSSTVRFPTV